MNEKITTGPKKTASFEKQRPEPTKTIGGNRTNVGTSVTVKGPLTSDFHRAPKVTHKPKTS